MLTPCLHPIIKFMGEGGVNLNTKFRSIIIRIPHQILRFALSKQWFSTDWKWACHQQVDASLSKIVIILPQILDLLLVSIVMTMILKNLTIELVINKLMPMGMTDSNHNIQAVVLNITYLPCIGLNITLHIIESWRTKQLWVIEGIGGYGGRKG
jgi:hypothetical protein